MYKKYFGLKRSPFEVSPDPFFLLPTDRYNEALACIYYGVCKRKGFVVLTGEVGTGKTLLVRCLLDLLAERQVTFANVFNPLLSPTDFLRYIVRDLGLRPEDQSKSDLLHVLNEFLIGRYRRGLTTVLVVDEAQHLMPEVLEEIRLLTNLETSQQKLLQILLVGQPELDRRLDSVDLRQLKQRVALRCRLEPLNEEEACQYIYRRLQKAGMTLGADSLFPKETVSAIHQCSSGIPRLINVICDNALIACFANQRKTVSPQSIRETSDDFRLNGQEAGKVVPIPPEPNEAVKKLLDLLESLKRVGPQIDSKPPTICL